MGIPVYCFLEKNPLYPLLFESTRLLKSEKKFLPPRLFEPTRLFIFGEIPNSTIK